MGIYSAKFALESAVSPEDVIQSGSEVGNDLEEIEKAVAGPDGLEASREEIENAEEGLIGDPVSEAFELIYESEYNYNQIMHTIGIHELKAASAGRDFILEAADKEGFFSRIKQWLKDMFAKVVKVFQKAITAIGLAASKDKTFVQKNKEAILAGANTDWTAKGYIYPDNIKYDVTAYRWDEDAKKKLYDLKTTNSGDVTLDDTEAAKAQILTNAVNGAKEISDVSTMLLKKLRGGEEKPIELNKSKISGQDVINILSSEHEKKAIKDVYDKIKKSYEESLKVVTNLEKELDKNDYIDTAPAFAVCAHYTNIIKFEKQVQTVVSDTLVKAANAKRNQARKLAVSFAAVGKSINKERRSTNESAETIFGKLNLV